MPTIHNCIFYCRPNQVSHLVDVFSRCINELSNWITSSSIVIKQNVYGLHPGTDREHFWNSRWLLVTKLFSHHQVPATLAYFFMINLTWSSTSQIPNVCATFNNVGCESVSIHYHQKLFVCSCMLLWPADLIIVIHSYLAYRHVISIDCSLYRMQLLNCSVVFCVSTMTLQYYATNFIGFRSRSGLIAKQQFLFTNQWIFRRIQYPLGLHWDAIGRHQVGILFSLLLLVDR